MTSKIREYQGNGIVVKWDAKRCIHAKECVKGLPAVFDENRRPWIEPADASPDELAEVIVRCPSGALHFAQSDSGLVESPPEVNIVLPVVDGPIYVHGDLKIATPDGETLRETRVALCRCGASDNKPFCDNSHLKINFQAPDRSAYPQDESTDVETGGTLEITPFPEGPNLLHGNFEIRSPDGRSRHHASKTALCRCGGSQNMPFCDGTHKTIGVSAVADQ